MAATVRVRAIEHLVGADPADELVPGEEYDLDEAYADRLIAAGYAEPAEAPPPKRRRKKFA